MTKEFILSEIKRTAEQNQGKVLGMSRFLNETGIKYSDWYGKYWSKWSDAIEEANLNPNSFNAALPSKYLLEQLAEVVNELKKFPSTGELRLRATNYKGFPSHNTFNRFGNKTSLVETFKKYCEENDRSELVQYCSFDSPKATNREKEYDSKEISGSVYLYKSGRHYKIGRTNDLKRRDREIKLQLPIEAELIHRIATDDAIGIEKYWHSRFSDKRLNGEWFNLTSADIKAFRRRKFM